MSYFRVQESIKELLKKEKKQLKKQQAPQLPLGDIYDQPAPEETFNIDYTDIKAEEPEDIKTTEQTTTELCW